MLYDIDNGTMNLLRIVNKKPDAQRMFTEKYGTHQYALLIRDQMMKAHHAALHNSDKPSGHCYVKVDIYFTAAGMIDIPTEEEIFAMMEEIRENPQEFRYVA